LARDDVHALELQPASRRNASCWQRSHPAESRTRSRHAARCPFHSIRKRAPIGFARAALHEVQAFSLLFVIYYTFGHLILPVLPYPGPTQNRAMLDDLSPHHHICAGRVVMYVDDIVSDGANGLAPMSFASPPPAGMAAPARANHLSSQA
jgi:hypothetical protein